MTQIIQIHTDFYLLSAKGMNICVKLVQSVTSVCLYIQLEYLVSNQNLKSERPILIKSHNAAQ
jgi:hypothetical protein